MTAGNLGSVKNFLAVVALVIWALKDGGSVSEPKVVEKRLWGWRLWAVFHFIVMGVGGVWGVYVSQAVFKEGITVEGFPHTVVPISIALILTILFGLLWIGAWRARDARIYRVTVLTVYSATVVAGFSMASLALAGLGVDGTRESLWYFVGTGCTWLVCSLPVVLLNFYSDLVKVDKESSEQAKS